MQFDRIIACARTRVLIGSTFVVEIGRFSDCGHGCTSGLDTSRLTRKFLLIESYTQKSRIENIENV